MSQNETTKLQENTGPDCWSCCSENKSEMVKLVDRCVFFVQAVLQRQAFLSFVFLHLMLLQFSLSCANLSCITFSKFIEYN